MTASSTGSRTLAAITQVPSTQRAHAPAAGRKLRATAVPACPAGPRSVRFHTQAPRKPFTFHFADDSWTRIARRTERLLDLTLGTARPLQPGETHKLLDSTLPMGEPRNPEGSVRLRMKRIDCETARNFVRDKALLFANAADVLAFSGEDILVVPREVTQAVGARLPLGHLLTPQEIQEHAAHGLRVEGDTVELQGYEFAMFMQPHQETPDGGTTLWNSQEPHLHEGEGEGEGPLSFHDQRLAHGFVPPGVTAVFAHTSGAEVVPGSTFFALRIGRREVHQFSTIRTRYLPREMQALLRTPGPLDADSLKRLQGFLDTHRVIPGLEFASMPEKERAEASVLTVPSHTWDPEPPEGVNLMEDLTVAVDPRKYPTLLPWSKV